MFFIKYILDLNKNGIPKMRQQHIVPKKHSRIVDCTKKDTIKKIKTSSSYL